MTSPKLLLLAATLPASLFATAASAEGVNIPYSRAALSNAAAAQAIYAEIAEAAELACRRAHRSISAVTGSARRESIADCVAATIEHVVNDIGVSTLYSVHEDETSRPAASVLATVN